jgi:RimJ/RimL family protein N-acetyltransferase
LSRLVKDKAVARYTTIPHPYPEAGMTEFLRRAIRETKAGRRHIFAIRRNTSNEPIGVIDLVTHYAQWQRMELGCWLGREFWNRGIMTQAVKLVLQFAFDVLKLHRVDVSLFEPNTASRRVIEKCWFRREGLTRDGACRGHKWHDLVNYGLLREDYQRVVNGGRKNPVSLST